MKKWNAQYLKLTDWQMPKDLNENLKHIWDIVIHPVRVIS